VPGNARQITRLWLPDQGSNLGPAVTVHRGPPLFQRLKRKFVPQLAQTRRRETLYWRGVHRNCGTNFSDVSFPF